jgi:Protein of unknown function (DUF2834).
MLVERRRSMKKNVYLILAIVGLVLPYYYFVSFLAMNGPDSRVFFKELFATRISSFFAVDLLISCVVFVRYLRREAVRYQIGKWWLYLLAMLFFGLSFALPLFLYVRELGMERGKHAEAGA